MCPPPASRRDPRHEDSYVKYVSLQALRALAVIMVVVYHAQGLCHKYAEGGRSITEAVLGEFGSHGVDLFFVLSGFVILYTVRKTNTGAAGFLLRRLIRIVPLYWLVTLAMIACGVILQPHGTIELRPIVDSLLFSSYAVYSRPPVLYVGWSVEYEIFFYAVVALALAAALPVYRAVGLAFLACYAALHLLVPAAQVSGNFAFFLGNPLIFEFVMGLLLAELAVGGRLRAWDFAIPAAAIGLSIALDGFGRLVFAGVPAAVVVWAAVKTESRTSRYKSTLLLARIGDASYSIYLIQVMALPGVGKLIAHLVPRIPGDLLIPIAVVLVVAAGMLTYAVIERPLLKTLQAALVPRFDRALFRASVTSGK
jgi:exopolysaccharide production protein ExoZ